MRIKIRAFNLQFLAICFFLCTVSPYAFSQVSRFTVNAPAVNMYSGPSQDEDVVSQALYGRTVEQLEVRGDWLKVRTPEDSYEGWVRKSELVPDHGSTNYASSGSIVEIRALRANLYREPSVSKHEPVIVLPFETRLEVVQFKENDSRWVQVRLPDGRIPWIQAGDVAVLPAGASPIDPVAKLGIQEMVVLSKDFLGLPYTWGGRTSFGYDCSGFVQMLMHERGYSLPRDADVQAAWSGFIPVDVKALRAGDVLYFGHDGKITHTGMFIGNGEFIHATTHEHPVIQISKLDAYWRKALIAQRRVKE
jgi:gamma-D-glutamyl-L-lysine dipeptidyl-peptidase